ncbi:MAG: VWA domain-containing protein [Halothiobacillus sp.]|jgi:Ca-activated chloride channel family protein|nr:VWA domain-containing protein [Halothiobacillus sp.]
MIDFDMPSALSMTAPWWLLALLPLPWFYAPIRRYLASRPAAVMLRHPLVEGSEHARPPSRRVQTIAGLWLGAYAALVIGLANPVWEGDFIPAPPPARSILLLVDASPSMQAEDFPAGKDHFISRIDAMKQGLLRFIAARPQDRFSLIVVTDSAGTLVPMTADHAVLDYWIRQLRAGINGSNTALGDGLAMAIRSIAAQSQAGQPAPLLVVWTDGFSTGGLMTPAEALVLARSYHIHLFTVNLAPKGGPPEDGQPSLAELADLTGGKPILAGDIAAMNEVTNQVALSESPKAALSTERRHIPLYAGFVILAALLLLFAQALLWQEPGAEG